MVVAVDVAVDFFICVNVGIVVMVVLQLVVVPGVVDLVIFC